MNMKCTCKTWQIAFLGLLLPLCAMGAQGDGSELGRANQTIENPRGEGAAETDQPLQRAPVQRLPGLKLSGPRQELNVGERPVSAHPLQAFRIFDARSELSIDEDGDGYYQRLRVIFDADVDAGDAFVFAQLYLSYEGGPWNHYFTTDVFHILEDVGYDDYEVVTRLLEGYPSGHYDVLIELYDADFDSHVDSYGPYDDPALSVLPLEDQARDSIFPVSVSHGGGGGLGFIGLLLIALAGYSRCRPHLDRESGC